MKLGLLQSGDEGGLFCGVMGGSRGLMKLETTPLTRFQDMLRWTMNQEDLQQSLRYDRVSMAAAIVPNN